MSLGGSSPYTNTDKTNKNKYTETKQYKKHSTNNTKPSKYKYTYYQNTHTYTHPHITKQVKTTTVQVKANTVQDISKWSSHTIINYTQYKVTLMHMVLLSPRTSL